MSFSPKRCLRCNSVRDARLLDVLPCEFCGASPKDVETLDLPVDDSWSGGLGRQRVAVGDVDCGSRFCKYARAKRGSRSNDPCTCR